MAGPCACAACCSLTEPATAWWPRASLSLIRKAIRSHLINVLQHFWWKSGHLCPRHSIKIKGFSPGENGSSIYEMASRKYQSGNELRKNSKAAHEAPYSFALANYQYC